MDNCRHYLTGPHNGHQFFIESVSVLFKKTSALVFHLFMGRHPLILWNTDGIVTAVASRLHLVSKVLNDEGLV